MMKPEKKWNNGTYSRMNDIKKFGPSQKQRSMDNYSKGMVKTKMAQKKSKVPTHAIGCRDHKYQEKRK